MNYRLTSAALLVALVTLLGACTDDGGTGVATAAGPPLAGATSPSGDTGQGGLAFVTCMRAEGIDMPDPTPGDTSGRGALRYELDVKGQGSNPAFQAALDKCTHLLPPVPPPTPVAAGDLAQELKFAACMRDNGVTGFPDPNPDGSWPSFWLLAGDKVGEKATRVCDHFQPVTASPSASG